MGKYEEGYAGLKNPESLKRFLLYDFIFMKLKNRQNGSVVIEIRTMIAYRGQRLMEGGMRKHSGMVNIFFILPAVLVL